MPFILSMNKFKLEWWKVVTIILLYYTVIGGFLIPVPRLHILNESIRMNYFHVPMWFAMMFQFTYSVWASIQYFIAIYMFKYWAYLFRNSIPERRIVITVVLGHP